MNRYVAISWPLQSLEAQNQGARCSSDLLAAGGWDLAVQRPGLEVWTAKGERLPVVQMHMAGAVLIGDVYEREPAQPGGTGAETLAPRAAARKLISSCWGAYIALLHDSAHGALWVLREPAGYLEAHTWRRGEIDVVSDELGALPGSLRPAQIALDWTVITELARHPGAATHLSPLAGVTPISPGELRRAGDGESAPELVWSPRDWVRNSEPASAAELRACVLRTVSCLASPEASLVTEVSGGLDSAIVTAALVEAGYGDRIGAALNYYGSRAAGDERAWAASLCNACDVPLTVVAQEVGQVTLHDLAELAARMGPAFGAADVFYDRDVARRARSVGASAIFGGQGGDAVFFQMPTTAVVADAVRRDWRLVLRSGVLQDTARWLRRSAWSVGAEVIRRRDWISPGTAQRGFWGPRAWQAPPAVRHPWLREIGTLPPAKQVQIQALVASHTHWTRSRRGETARVVHPLLAQPVLEFCLGTPAWQLTQGGRDRAFAREALGPMLPAMVAQRRSKGALNALFSQRAAASLDVLRPHLLEGALVGAGVLDPAALSAALDPDRLIWKAEGARLIRLAVLESWVRHWQGRVPDADVLWPRS